MIVAMIFWAWAEVRRLRVPTGDRLARALSTAGILLALAHTAAAFHFVHGWSHARALADTARQTAALFGVDWAGGLYINYAFLALWCVDVGSWWLAPVAHRSRSPLAQDVLLGVFVFMFLNGAVLFGRGPARVLGAAAIGIVLWTWYQARFVPWSFRAAAPK
jgi:hypothetical protein